MCVVFTMEMMKESWKSADISFDKMKTEGNERMGKLVKLSGISPDDLIEMEGWQIEKLMKKFNI